MVFSVDVCASALMHTSRQCQYQQQREQTLHPDTGLSPFLLRLFLSSRFNGFSVWSPAPESLNSLKNRRYSSALKSEETMKILFCLFS